MILTFPTGYYETVLPQKASDIGNVTYTCSNGPPPRATLSFPQMTSIIANNRRPIHVLTALEIRQALIGSLTASAMSAGVPEAGLGAKTYEPGDVIDFSTAPTQTPLTPINADDPLDLRHDLNVLDLSAMGLDAAATSSITQSAQTAFNALAAQYNDLNRQYIAQETLLTDLQKSTNETQKAINAANVIVAVLANQDAQNMLGTLIARLADLTAQTAQAIIDANTIAAQVAVVESNIRSVAQLVK